MAKPERFMLVADSHGDWVDQKSEEAVFGFIADFKPTIRVHLGDVWEFACLRKGADDDEITADLREDWKVGKDFLKRFFRGAKDPVLLLGNHDDRLWELADSKTASGSSKALAHGMLEEFDALRHRMHLQTVLPYDSRLGVYELGHLKCLHGYHCGMNAANQHARIYGNCAFGHTHTIENATAHSHEEPKESRGIGALCRLDRPFNKKQTNKLRHSNGFAYGFVFPDGHYSIYQARKINGSYCVATDLKEY